MSLEKEFNRQSQFEQAYDLTPLKLKQWMAKHQGEHLEVELFRAFILPLQREIETLRYRREEAIPFEQSNSNSDDVPY